VSWSIWFSKVARDWATNRLLVVGLTARPPAKSRPLKKSEEEGPTIFRTLPLPPPTASETNRAPVASMVTLAALGMLSGGRTSRPGAVRPEAADADGIAKTVSPVWAANCAPEPVMPKSPLSALSVT